MFTSFLPDVCAALNWKQPNCKYLHSCSLPPPLRPDGPYFLSDPVFFASLCGRESSANPSPNVLAHAEAGDARLSSLESAVRFSKANNLLGVIVEGDILVKTHLTSISTCSLFDFLILLCSRSRHSNVDPYLSNNERCETEKFGPDFRLGWMGSGGIVTFSRRPFCIF